MKNTTLTLCHESIYPGESLSLALPLPEIFSCAPLYMPIKVIHGKKAGPCLLVTAAMHGNELNGTEIINRLLNKKAVQKLQGTLIAVPVMNVYGLMNRTRTLPGGRELDRSFPGSPHGTHAARICHLFVNEVLKHADVCIDLQTGFLNYSNLPQVYANLDDAKTENLAKAFNAPVISEVIVEKGSLRETAIKEKKPLLVYEAGEAMRFDEHAIKTGVRGVTNVMRQLDMLTEKYNQKPEAKHFITKDNVWIRAATSGVSHSDLQLGQLVEKGDVLTVIRDPFGAGEPVTMKAPYQGVISAKNNLPLVHEGEALFRLAVFERMNAAIEHLEDWEDKNREQ